jgi:hypothetical protein
VKRLPLALVFLLAAACTSGPSSSGSSTTAADLPPAAFATSAQVGSLVVTVGVPMPFTPSSSAAGADGGGRGVRVEVTAVNNAASALSAGRVVVRATGGGRQLESVVDSAQGVEPPAADILPGASLTWSEAWMAPGEPGELTVQVVADGARGYWAGQF